jgi:hypothetical protein
LKQLISRIYAWISGCLGIRPKLPPNVFGPLTDEEVAHTKQIMAGIKQREAEWLAREIPRFEADPNKWLAEIEQHIQ